MENVQIYQTNAGLGYMEYAYLVKIKDNEYLVVGAPDDSFSYRIGSVVADLTDNEVKKSDISIHCFDIIDSFLFKQYGQLQAENKRLRELLLRVTKEYRLYVNQTNEGLLQEVKTALNS